MTSMDTNAAQVEYSEAGHTTLADEASGRRCCAMGCKQVVMELNSSLGTKFDLRRSYVTLSLHFCIYQS